MIYTVKEFKIFGKYPARIWVDDKEMIGGIEIKTTRGIISKPLPRKTVEKYVKAIQKGKIKPIDEYPTDLDL